MTNVNLKEIDFTSIEIFGVLSHNSAENERFSTEVLLDERNKGLTVYKVKDDGDLLISTIPIGNDNVAYIIMSKNSYAELMKQL